MLSDFSTLTGSATRLLAVFKGSMYLWEKEGADWTRCVGDWTDEYGEVASQVRCGLVSVSGNDIVTYEVGAQEVKWIKKDMGLCHVKWTTDQLVRSLAMAGDTLVLDLLSADELTDTISASRFVLGQATLQPQLVPLLWKRDYKVGVSLYGSNAGVYAFDDIDASLKYWSCDGYVGVVAEGLNSGTLVGSNGLGVVAWIPRESNTIFYCKNPNGDRCRIPLDRAVSNVVAISVVDAEVWGLTDRMTLVSLGRLRT